MAGSYEDDCKDSGQRRTFSTGAVRDMQSGKGRFDLISPVGLRRLARRYEHGGVKYGPNNWQKGIPISSCIDSAMRHLTDYTEGLTNEDHLAAAAWNIFTAMQMEVKKPEMQDIPTRPDFCTAWGQIWENELEAHRQAKQAQAKEEEAK